MVSLERSSPESLGKAGGSGRAQAQAEQDEGGGCNRSETKHNPNRRCPYLELGSQPGNQTSLSPPLGPPHHDKHPKMPPQSKHTAKMPGASPDPPVSPSLPALPGGQSCPRPPPAPVHAVPHPGCPSGGTTSDSRRLAAENHAPGASKETALWPRGSP